MRHDKEPYESFGRALKMLRAASARSTAEVSGAVEIDEKRLASYENGEQRPSEDILQLLLQHFDVNGDKADELWKLAGYNTDEQDNGSHMFMNDDFGGVEETTVLVTPHDARIVYTDMLQVMVNNYGVIMNFMQGAGPSNQPLAVSRVGMSKEHARTIIDVLQKTLDQAENTKKPSPKQLGSGSAKSSHNQKD